MTQPDLFGGRAARDAGMKRVLETAPSYSEDCLTTVIAALPSGWVGTGEDVKHQCVLILGPAHHVNVWGAVTNAAVRRRLLVKTGRWLKAKDKKAHARNVQEYRRS